MTALHLTHGLGRVGASRTTLTGFGRFAIFRAGRILIAFATRRMEFSR